MGTTGESGTPALAFVYNVDATPVAMLRDLWSGLTTGETDCRLCDLTFGRLLKDRGWKDFVDGLPLEVDFSLRSTFVRRHPSLDGHRFPAAFLVEGTTVGREVIDAEAIEACGDLDALRELVATTVDSLDIDGIPS
ncbi:hypothetical protein [Actinospongicola halichondriae]|uniref:hypothetical protein n=1 Tax=Actinospongicola halichondriae TaxID=3236844 RepID=UPI003D4E9C4F